MGTWSSPIPLFRRGLPILIALLGVLILATMVSAQPGPSPSEPAADQSVGNVTSVIVVTATATPAPANGNVMQNVTCPAGMVALGGGFEQTNFGGEDKLQVFSSYPIGNPPAGWHAYGYVSGQSSVMVVYAVCARITGLRVPTLTPTP